MEEPVPKIKKQALLSAINVSDQACRCLLLWPAWALPAGKDFAASAIVHTTIAFVTLPITVPLAAPFALSSLLLRQIGR